MKNRKGIQLNQAFGAVLTLVLIAVLVIVGIYMFTSLASSIPPQSRSIVNESGYINTAGYTLANSSDCNFASVSISSVTNLTGSYYVIPSTNYTISSNGVLTNATPTTYTGVHINYAYTTGGDTCIAANSMVTNFSTYPTLVGLVGTIIFLGIVIGVLVASFVFGGKPSA